MFRHQLIIRVSIERDMLENLQVQSLMQLETNPSLGIITRLKENIGERKSNTPIPKQVKVV